MSSTSEQKREESSVGMTASSVMLEEDLSIPVNEIGIVLFAHDISRHGTRNGHTAETLQAAG